MAFEQQLPDTVEQGKAQIGGPKFIIRTLFDGVSWICSCAHFGQCGAMAGFQQAFENGGRLHAQIMLIGQCGQRGLRIAGQEYAK